MAETPTVREAEPRDEDAIWAVLQPIFAEGETYCMPQDVSRADALSYWSGHPHRTFVVDRGGSVVATYFLTPNQRGGGSHVSNCGFATTKACQGLGIARLMLDHAQDEAIRSGFRAMQFNFVVSTNERAVCTWERNGFSIVGRLPGAFQHPSKGFVDALVMFKTLVPELSTTQPDVDALPHA